MEEFIKKMQDQEFRTLMKWDLVEYMLKGGGSLELAQYLLFILYNYYKEDYIIKEDIEELVLAIHQKLLENDGYVSRRNLQGEVLDAVLFRGGGDSFTINDIYNDLKLSTPDEKSMCRVALQRLVAKNHIEKVNGGKSGIYRSITAMAEKTQFLSQPNGEYVFRMPLDLSTMCKIFPKNMIIVAGSKSSGKTALLLNTAIMNQNNKRVVYLNSEMGDEEFTERMIKLGCKGPEDVKFECFKKASNYHDMIKGDDAIYIIDFLEIHEDFYKIGKYLKLIHDKLKDGVAIVGLQMKAGGNLGRGAEFSKEVSRLYLSMDYDPSLKATRVAIEEMKSPKIQPGYRGWHRYVKIIDGSKLSPIGGWTDAITTPEKKAYSVAR